MQVCRILFHISFIGRKRIKRIYQNLIEGESFVENSTFLKNFDFRKIIKKENIWQEKLAKITKALAKIGTDEEITENDLTSAWIALNTRTVYLSHTSDGSKVPNGTQVSRDSDDTSNWALVPFLDCLNHHSNAKIETSHSNTHFQITSLAGKLVITVVYQ